MFILVSRGQTAYFSFGVGAEKNKGLAYYRFLCTKHATVVRQTLIFLRPHTKRKISGLATRDYVYPSFIIITVCVVCACIVAVSNKLTHRGSRVPS